ncbi:MAG: MmgE/PrpD family protein [Chloroflexi bacterium]|nr:MmgE/PrpD family protein [Chloroflexota bacterium]
MNDRLRSNTKGQLSETLSKLVCSIGFDDLDGVVIHEVKRLLIDSLACALAGQSTNKGKIAMQLAQKLGGPKESTVIGAQGKVSCCNASFANGELINALDWDALCRRHFPPIAIPPALAVAESTGASGKELITAIALALELMARFDSATTGLRKFGDDGTLIMPAVQGYSSSIFGAVTGVGKLLRLDTEKMAHAIGIAGCTTAVPSGAKFNNTMPAAMTKYAPVGWLCTTAVTAALLAEMNYRGDSAVTDGEYGFWRFSCSEDWHPDRVVSRLCEDWVFLNPGLQYKEYPACGVIQVALDLFIRTIEENNLVPEDIELVQLWLDPQVEQAFCTPREPVTEVDTQFDFTHVIAVAAHRIPPGPEWHDRKTQLDPAIRQFCRKVSIQTHPGYAEAKRADYASWLSKVEVTARGKKFEVEGKYSKFARDLRSPVKSGQKDEDIIGKFKRCSSNVLKVDQAARLLESLLKIEELADVSEMLRLLRESY